MQNIKAYFNKVSVVTVLAVGAAMYGIGNYTAANKNSGAAPHASAYKDISEASQQLLKKNGFEIDEFYNTRIVMKDEPLQTTGDRVYVSKYGTTKGDTYYNVRVACSVGEGTCDISSVDKSYTGTQWLEDNKKPQAGKTASVPKQG